MSSEQSENQTGSRVPDEDERYAIELAFEVARVAKRPPVASGIPDRTFMEVFESQLETHWNCLVDLHAEETSPEPSTEQTKLFAGGPDYDC